MTHTHVLKASEHPVKSVTIYKESNESKAKAEVVRTFTVDLKSGENRIEIRGLSSVLDTESVRVTGLGESVRLFDIVCIIKPPHHPSEDDPKEVVRRLLGKRKLLESAKRVREHGAEIFVNYGKSLQGEHVNPEQATSFLSTFVAQGQEHVEAVMDIEEKLFSLDRLIKAESDKIAERKGEANGAVDVTVSAREDVRVEFKLAYIVARASWEPNYDLHATAANGPPSSSVIVHYRARVLQSTGEDWKDTILTLSTASSDANSMGVPYLKELHVKPYMTPRFGNPFGASNNQQQAFAGKGAGLFGQKQATQASNIFRGAVQQQVPTGSGLFGSSNTAPAANSGGLFGSSGNSGTTTTGTGLFGRFGQQAQQAPGGLFGSSGTSTGSGAFGQSSGGQNGFGAFGAVPTSGTSTFGSAVPAPAPTTGGALFGGTTAAAPVHAVPAAPVQQLSFGSTGTAPASAPTDATAPVEDEDEFEEVAAPDTNGVEAKTIVSESPLSMTFTVEGRSSVPSDNAPHQVLITSIPFEADVSYICVPRAETVAYLQCMVKNTSDYRLLPGPVSVFLDDSFVSKTKIFSDVKNGDYFGCTLGADPAIRITYIRGQKSTKATGGAFSDQFKTVTYTVSTTVRNSHRFALPVLRVQDGVPLTDKASSVKVVLRRPEGLAEAKHEKIKVDGTEVGWKGILGEEKGQVEWMTKVEAGGVVKLALEWEIRGPADMQWRLASD